jgi:putative membrane protein
MASARGGFIAARRAGFLGCDPMATRFLPHLLLAAYAALFVWAGMAPYDRTVWVAENIPIVLIVAGLVFLYFKRIRFSLTAYVLMSILIFLHTIGGHFTFERVPFEWFNSLFGFERNMYDRIAHASVGFYTFAVAEWLEQSGITRRYLTFSYALFAVAFIAMGYEIIEWLFAVTSDPAAGGAFLGSQGDVWDAQKDMLADTLGAVFALFLYALLRKPTQISPRVC